MNSEFEVLSHLEKNQDTSQRKISRKTGISVGTVNLLLKKMVRKGLVKIERLNAKSLRYIITPQGIAEKTRLAYQFLKISYEQIIRIESVLGKIVSEHQPDKGELDLVFCGLQDEILEIIKISANNLGIKYKTILSIDELYCNENDSINSEIKNNTILVLTWNFDIMDNLPSNIKNVNILAIL